MKKVLIIVINYASENEVVEYAKQISSLENNENIALCVVDNKHSEKSINLEESLKGFPYEIHYYDAKANLGYMNGALFGLDRFKAEQNYIPDWVVISNTDIFYTDSNFYKDFLSKDYPKDYWCVAPSVVDTQGNYCNPHYKERIPLAKVNRVIKIFSKPFLMYLYFKLASLKTKLNKSNIKQPSQTLYSVHGCFFILRKEFFEALGEEKYGVVLYSEESFVAEIILENKKLEFYDSTLEVKHNENLTTSKLGLAKKGKYMSSSMAYIKKRFYK